MLRALLTVLLPPVSVYVHTGFGRRFWLNLLLTLFFYLPGVLHAFYVIRK